MLNHAISPCLSSPSLPFSFPTLAWHSGYAALLSINFTKCTLLMFSLISLNWWLRVLELDEIFRTHAFSHIPNAPFLHYLLPQGRKKQALPSLKGKKAEAESGADRTMPLPL